MDRRSFSNCLLGLIALLVIASGRQQAVASASAVGSLLVESEPAGASVYIDGRLAGQTPLTLQAIAAGAHRVRVVRLGYLENSRLVTVRAGTRGTLRMRLTDPVSQAPQRAALKIVVIDGEGAVNIIQQKTAVAPVVEVRDRNDQPVAGAVVSFTIRSGRASFNGARMLSLSTDAAGRATATGLTPIGNGAVRIGASAMFQGQTAAVTIAQTNVLTAAEASVAASSGTGAAGAGTGLSHTAIAGIVGGAGAGIAGAVLASSGGARTSPVINASPTGTGIKEVTMFSFTASGGDASATHSWDFGDGSQASGGAVSHVFSSEGTFQVALKVGEQTTTTTVVVGSLTGTWTVRITQFQPIHTHRLLMTQQAGRLSGQWIVDYESGPLAGTANVSVLAGTISDPRAVTITQSGECQRVFTAAANATLTTIGGPLAFASPACTGPGPMTVTR
jgi:hypothetical protein